MAKTMPAQPLPHSKKPNAKLSWFARLCKRLEARQR